MLLKVIHKQQCDHHSIYHIAPVGDGRISILPEMQKLRLTISKPEQLIVSVLFLLRNNVEKDNQSRQPISLIMLIHIDLVCHYEN